MAKLYDVNSPIPVQAVEFIKCFPGNKLFATMPKDGGKFITYPSSMDTMQTIKQSNDNGHHVFFTINEVRGSTRKADDVIRCRAIFADFDTPASEPKTDWPIPPSIIVKSSTVEEGNKYHYYWLTDTKEFEEWKLVEEGLVNTYGADTGCKDLSRVLRIPGYKNPKNDSLCELIDCNSQVYDWLFLISKFPPILVEKSNELAGKTDGEFNEQIMFKRFFNPTEDGWITNSMNSCIQHWAHHYGKSKIIKKIDNLFEEISEESLQIYAERYMAARKQAPKFIISAIEEVKTLRAKEGNIINLAIRARSLPSFDQLEFVPIPKHSIPDSVYRAAEELSKFSAIGVEPAIIAAISITCAMLSKNIKIHEMGEHTTTYCSTGIVIAMETGTRKTSIYKHMSKPFSDYEQLIQKKWEEEKHDIYGMEHILESQLKKIEKDIKTAVDKGISAAEIKAFVIQRAQVTKQIEELQTDKPTLHIKDITEEEVISKMHENQGAISVVSDDSRNIIKNILGRYSNDSTAEGWVIDGMGGTTIKYNRAKNSGTEYIIHDPCLNIFLMVQPDIAIQFKNHPVYKESGMAARVPMYFYPVNTFDLLEKSDRTRRLDESAMKDYYTVLRELQIRRLDNPLIIELSPSAEERFNKLNSDFIEWLKTKWLGEYKKTNKLVTQAVVMSTVMAALDDNAFRVALQTDPEKNIRYTLDRKHANMGCDYIEAIYSGMVKSTENLDYINTTEVAHHFVRNLLIAYKKNRIYEGFINSSHLENTFGMLTKENRTAVIDMLVEYGWLHVVKSTEHGSLNLNWPGGVAKIGEAIYHLNINDVESLLQQQEIKGE